MTFTIDPPVIPPNSLVLVTGITGFIASHIAKVLLERGYRVRGTARNLEKVEWVNEFFEKEFGAGRVETVVVEDMVEEGAFDAAVKGEYAP